jgi:hypothetical protein
MAFVNDYKIMDVFNAIDQHTNDMLIPARIFVGSSFDGGDPDFGQAQQRVINTDELSYVYHLPDPRMEWPAVAGYGVHENAGEIGYIIKGTYDLSYPDGTNVHLKPGCYFKNEKGQPYRLVGADDDLGGTYAVFYSTKAQKIGNKAAEKGNAGHESGFVPELKKLDNAPKGIDVTLVGECDNVVLFDVVVKPGVAYPADGWMTTNCHQVLAVLSGEGMGIYPDRDYRFKTEFAAYHKPDQPYKFINIGSEDLHMLAAFNAKNAKSIKFQTVQITNFV